MEDDSSFAAVSVAIQKRLPEWFDDRRVKCKYLGDLMFPGGEDDEERPRSLTVEVAQAKSLCNGTAWAGDTACFFREKCLHHAIDFKENTGVWGGTSERDRRKIQRARNRYHANWIYSLEDIRFPLAVIIKFRPVRKIKRRPRRLRAAS